MQVERAWSHPLKVPHETFFGGCRPATSPIAEVTRTEVVQAPGVEVQPDGRVALPD